MPSRHLRETTYYRMTKPDQRGFWIAPHRAHLSARERAEASLKRKAAFNRGERSTT